MKFQNQLALLSGLEQAPVPSLGAPPRVPRGYFWRKVGKTWRQTITQVEQHLRQIKVCAGFMSTVDIIHSIFCSNHSRLLALRCPSKVICNTYRWVPEPSTCNCLFRHEIVPMLLTLRNFGNHLIRDNNCL